MHRFAIKNNLALLNRVEPRNQAQKRRFTATRCTQNRNEFALKNRKVDIFQNLSRFARAFIDKGAVYIANLQDFFFI